CARGDDGYYPYYAMDYW
nr:immunoglobulin heavy chain junction region [Mus musculus]MBK4195539.1 immunoglobulin heavy chain junction region [Mus musculus]MBK4197665.1 immunoglobulin heavy chain junction region [Mus musculus]MBK4197666.1 immunoglobulin heavy chain junction region [Mus musculus]MBK4197667.1 immunoglobulin heavy chain junction region [Mus musculus]